MRFIAHRILRDGKSLGSLDEHRIATHDGVELDLRLSHDGDLMVRHSPLFGGRRGHRRGAGHPFRAVTHLLSGLPRAPRMLLLDVKCPASARAAALEVAVSQPGPEIAFVCWHSDEIVAIRNILPAATILYCIAPIMARRERERDNFYLANSFPFVWTAERFMPPAGKHNRHNINVRLIAPDSRNLALPQGVDGVCVHRVFWKPEFAAIAQAQRLQVAVYGLSSRERAVEAAMAGRFDLAIMGRPKGGRDGGDLSLRDGRIAADARSRPIAA